MSTVEEIEAAIAQLPKDQFWALTDRLIALRGDDWDRQIEADIRAGKLDALAQEAIADLKAGRTRPFPG